MPSIEAVSEIFGQKEHFCLDQLSNKILSKKGVA